MITEIINKATGKIEQVDVKDVAEFLGSKKYSATEKTKIGLLDKDSKPSAVMFKDLPTHLKEGFQIVDRNDLANAIKLQKVDESTFEGVKATLEGALDMGTFSAGNWLLRKAGVVDPEKERLRAKAWSTARGIGEAGGLIGSLLLPTGWAGLAGKATKAVTFAPRLLAGGTKLLEKSLAKSLGSKLVAKTAAYGTEASVYGLQHAVSEYQLGNPEYASQKLLFSKGMEDMLVGSLYGAGFPIVGNVIGKIGRLAKIPKFNKVMDVVYNKWGNYSGKSREAIKKWINVLDEKVGIEFKWAKRYLERPDEDISKLKDSLQKFVDNVEDVEKKIFDSGVKNKITDGILDYAEKEPELAAEGSAMISSFFGKEGYIEKLIRKMQKTRVRDINIKSRKVFNSETGTYMRIADNLDEAFDKGKSSIIDLLRETQKLRDELHSIDKKTLSEYLKTRKLPDRAEELFPQLTKKQRASIPAIARIKKRYQAPEMFTIPKSTEFWDTPTITELTKAKITGKAYLKKLMATKKFIQNIREIKEAIRQADDSIPYDLKGAYNELSNVYNDVNNLLMNPTVVGDDVAQLMNEHSTAFKIYDAANENFNKRFVSYIQKYDDKIKVNKRVKQINHDRVKTAIYKDSLNGDQSGVKILEQYLDDSSNYVNKINDLNYGKTIFNPESIELSKYITLAKNASELSNLFKDSPLSVKDIATAVPPFLIGQLLGIGWGGGALLLLGYRAMKSPSSVISTFHNLGGAIRTVSKRIKSTADILSGIGTKTSSTNMLSPLATITTLNIGDNDEEKIIKVMDNVNAYRTNPEKLYNGIKYMNMTLEENAPNLAVNLGTNMVNAMNFLANKMPQTQRTPFMANLDRPKYSKTEILKFATYLNAMNKPVKILDNIDNGTISKEEIEILKNVYPAVYDEIKTRIIENLSTLKKEPDYKTKNLLGKIFGIQFSHAGNPQNITLIQNTFKPVENEQTGGVTARKAIKTQGDINQSEMQRLEGRRQ